MKHKLRILPVSCLALGALLCLSGCTTMAPKYSRPAAPVSNAWPAGPAYQEQAANQAQKPLDEIPWREFFIDEQLRQLIALALENNVVDWVLANAKVSEVPIAFDALMGNAA